MKAKANKYFKFCPRCSHQLDIRKSGKYYKFKCGKCKFDFYQNSHPTSSAFIVNDQQQIMLVKRGINPKKGYLDTPGGFLEDGEDPVSGLKREMHEELNIRLKNIKLLGIYLDKYDDCYNINTLNIIYAAAIARGKLRPQDDVSEIKWFDKKDIPWEKVGFKWVRKALKDYLSQ